MKNTIFIVISLTYFTFGLITAEAQVAYLKTCSHENPLSCPKYSLCSQISNDENEALKCICIENFQLNLNWLEYENLKNSSVQVEEHYCLSSDEVSSKKENQLIVYMRSPARKEHLAFGILMVLLAAALATAVIYGLKILRPLKRTKSFYQKLVNKRRNITPLQELDELELNRRYEMQTL